MSLSDKVQKRKACINVENTDQYCFKWCLIAAVDTSQIKSKQRCSSYNIHDITADIICNQNGVKLDFKNLIFPISLKDIKIFEKRNSGISVNVFGYDEENNVVVGPYYITK